MAQLIEAGQGGDNETTDIDEARKALVGDWCKRVRHAKGHHKKAFDRMKEDMEIYRTGTSEKSFRSGRKYVANIIQRHVAQRVSTLYAKNPQATAELRQRRDFRVWDGNPTSLAQAYQDVTMASQTGMLGSPQSLAILQDYQEGTSTKKMMEGVGDTMVKLFHYFLDEQIPGFKTQMKKLVRRTVITGVGFVKLGFQRDMQRDPEIDRKISDIAERLAHIERLASEIAQGDITQYDAEAEELRLALQALQSQPLVVMREGLVFDFPASSAIIVDPACKYLQGFVGAGWIAHEILLPVDEVKEVFNVDLKKGCYTMYNRSGQENRGSGNDTAKDIPYACIWNIYDKVSGLELFVCDGYEDFLEEPTAPNVSLERFFPIYTLIFNDVESEDDIYPTSDVRLLIPMQDEHNRAREGLREHRRAARPRYVAAKAAFEKDDKEAFKSAEPHSVTEINMSPQEKVGDKIQAVPVVGVDPNLYITTHLMEDIQLVVGAQEAHFGGVAGATATETSVAEGARMSSLQSNVDDLDDFFTDIARDSGQVLMMEMSAEQVAEIVGPGAVWPTMSKEQIVKEVFLKIKAGSSGRPNKAADLANLERVLPYLLQIPGIDPGWLAEEVLRRLDDHLDVGSAIKIQLPSITAINGMSQPGTGDPTTSPEQQGGKGKFNNPGGQSRKAGSSAPMGPNNLPGV